MFSARQSGMKALLAGIAAAGTLALAGAAQAQSIVVRSTGPSAAQYPQGKRLPANASVTLRSGDRLTVLDRAGTRVISGPGSFTLNGSVNRDQTGSSRIGNIIAGGGAQRPRFGAVRGAPPSTMGSMSQGPDSVWYIDVTKGGSYCVADPRSLVLWRPNRDQPASGKLTPLVGGRTQTVMWTAGSPLRQWPATLPVTSGATYTFSDPVGPTVRITIHVLPTVPTDQLELAGLLADQGCAAQLDVLANAAGPSSSGG
jgi:hypothetical protein